MKPSFLFLLLSWFFYVGVYAQPLDSLKAELRRSNPELRALQLDFEAATKVGRQQDQLPDLELGAGAFLFPVETRTGPQQFRLGATQMLPWPGKLAAMAVVADARARPLLEQVAAQQLALLFRLESAYIQLAGYTARAEVLRGSLALYASMELLALRRVESGKGSTVEVYRLQLAERQTERQLAELAQRAQLEMATINELLNRSSDTQVTARMDFAQRVREILDYAPDLAADYPDLSKHPSLRFFTLQQEVNQATIELSKLDQRPDFGVGLDYIAVGRRNDVAVSRNGRDVILPRAMVRLPLSKGKYSAKRQEEEVRIKALDARREATENAFRTQIRRALVRIDDAANHLFFLAEQTRITEAALAVSRTEYANDQRPFDELLQLENQLVGYRTQSVEAQMTILLQNAVIDRYLINQ